MKAPGADSAGRLVGTMLEVVLAELCEPERLRRGRRYARQGAVMELSVAPGIVAASVQGSRANPYDVQIRLTRGGMVAGPTRLADLVPASASLRFECTCPDYEEPCKHGAAVMTELAERVAYDPALLATWRDASAVAVEDEIPDDPPPDRSGVGAAELDAFLGAGHASVAFVPALTALPHVQLTWDEPWSVMLHDALRVVSRTS